MITLTVTALSAAFGAGMAWRRKGKVLDILQYAAVFALIGLMIGTALTIGINRAS